MRGRSRSENGVASFRLWPAHPRLDDLGKRKAWMAGSSPAMTIGAMSSPNSRRHCEGR